MSPIPSILIKSSNFLDFAREMKFFNDFKFLEINFAFSKPICLIPNAKINLSKEIVFLRFIEYFKLDTDSLPQPSKFSILA